MTEIFKGVLWRRPPHAIKGVLAHPYVVVGMLVTSEEIPDVANEIVLAGASTGMTGLLGSIDRAALAVPGNDANSVLTSLGTLIVLPEEAGLVRRPGESWRSTLKRSLQEVYADPEVEERLTAFDLEVDQGIVTSCAVAMKIMSGDLIK